MKQQHEWRSSGINVFCDSRRKWLGIPYAESIQLLYTAGWTSHDLFCVEQNGEYDEPVTGCGCRGSVYRCSRASNGCCGFPLRSPIEK